MSGKKDTLRPESPRRSAMKGAGDQAQDDSPDDYNTSLTLLGTTGGMTWWPNSNRAGNSQVLKVGDAMYLVDLGTGSLNNFSKKFNVGYEDYTLYNGKYCQSQLSSFLSPVRALFLTHLHMDHLGDYPTYLEIGVNTGLEKIVVIGPGSRGKLEDNKSGYTGAVIYADRCKPDTSTPTPGTKLMTAHILQAFAQTFNDCTHDEGYPDLPSLLDIREIGDPDTIPWPDGFVEPDPDSATEWTAADTCPAMDPFVVYKDELVTVTATLVNHFMVYPAFAYRFDTADGSIVISGDTGPKTCGNLQKLAKGADVLVHEVIDSTYIELLGENDPDSRLYEHMTQAHTSSADISKVAISCGVKMLVMSHIAPANADVDQLKSQGESVFKGDVLVGHDRKVIGLGEKISINKA